MPLGGERRAGASAADGDGETPDGTNTLVEEVRYDLQDLDRFPDSFKNIAKRNRQREQLALERLAARGRGEGSGYCAAFLGYCGYV